MQESVELLSDKNGLTSKLELIQSVADPSVLWFDNLKLIIYAYDMILAGSNPKDIY
jgi:hypothetical protein